MPAVAPIVCEEALALAAEAANAAEEAEEGEEEEREVEEWAEAPPMDEPPCALSSSAPSIKVSLPTVPGMLLSFCSSRRVSTAKRCVTCRRVSVQAGGGSCAARAEVRRMGEASSPPELPEASPPAAAGREEVEEEKKRRPPNTLLALPPPVLPLPPVG